MYLVFHKVCQLQHIGITYSDWMIEWFSCSPIKQLYLASFWQIGTTQIFLYVLFCSSIKDRCSDLYPQGICSPSQMGFHYLPDIHSVWYTQGVQNDIHWRAIRQERHILYR